MKICYIKTNGSFFTNVLWSFEKWEWYVDFKAHLLTHPCFENFVSILFLFYITPHIYSLNFSHVLRMCGELCGIDFGD